MKKALNQQKAPWSIAGAAALFMGGAALLTLLEFASAQPVGNAATWMSHLLIWAIFGGSAWAVVRGQNWVRWLWGGAAIPTVFSALTPCFCRIRTTPEEEMWIRAIQAAWMAATALCFFPASNRHFGDKRAKQKSAEATSGLAPGDGST